MDVVMGLKCSAEGVEGEKETKKYSSWYTVEQTHEGLYAVDM